MVVYVASLFSSLFISDLVMLTLFVLFVFVSAEIPSTNGDLTSLSDCTKGRITYYSGYEQNTACNFGVVSTVVTEGYFFRAAANTALFNTAQQCGICYEAVGPNGAIRFMVSDECPVSSNEEYCSGDMMHFDLAENAFPYLADTSVGVTNITFRMVSCDHTGNIQIKPLTGNGETYYAFIVMDHVIGVKGASYSLDSGASYIELTRTEYNAFVVEANTIPSTFKLKITSIANEDLIVDINSYTDTIDTQQQFTIPNSFFDIQTLEETTKPSNLDICCPAPDDVTVIYDDLVRGIWTISSSATLDSTSSPYSGSYCINIDIPQWSVMQFDADYYLDLDLYTAVSFYVKTNQAGTNCFEVKKMSGSSNIGTYVSIESANTWQYVELTFEELGVTTGEDFKCFEIQNRLSSPTNYYFDDVKLIRSSVSTRVCADGTVSTESSSSEEVIESSSSEEVIESSSSEVATESSSSEILIESSSSEVVTESSSSEEGESSSDPIISSGEKEESSSHGQSSEGESENIISESNSSNELDDGAKRSGIAGMIFGVLVYCLLM